MGFGSIITRAIISGTIRAVADAAREQTRIERANQSSKPFREIASAAIKEVSPPTTAIPDLKVLRLVTIIDGLLEQTRDEWLPVYRAGSRANSPLDKVYENSNKSLHKVGSHLTEMGFPYDTDWDFSVWVSHIHWELMIHKALPEAWKEWNQDLDDLLERAAGEAKRVVQERRVEILAKVMPDGRSPTDEEVFRERLMVVARELSESVIAPALTSTGLLANNLVFAVRLGKLISEIMIRDILEFNRELSQQSDVT